MLMCSKKGSEKSDPYLKKFPDLTFTIPSVDLFRKATNHLTKPTFTSIMIVETFLALPHLLILRMT